MLDIKNQNQAAMSKKLTQEQFLDKCIATHGNRYDYSMVNYNGGREKIIIICRNHGQFLQAALNHSSGQGCKKCYHEKRMLGNSEFINQSKSIHGEIYDYSLSDYRGSKRKIKIICKKHGVFLQVANYHLMGNGCPKCARELVADFVKKDREYIIKKSREAHGDKYDYSKVRYSGVDVKVCIICPKHGEFWQTASDHMRGRNCYECSRDAQSDKLMKSLNEFISASKLIHGDKYSYDKSVYNGTEKRILITCPKHGDFKQRAGSHMVGRGCPSCCESKGEKKVRVWLRRNGFKFKREKLIYTRPRSTPQRFDFFISDLNTAIEYHGEQHYRPNNFFGGMPAFRHIQKLDKIKRDFCSNTGIRLIEIPYYHYEEVEKILFDTLIKKVV